MTLRFLGTGTSQGVPVIGCECEVCLSIDPRDQRLRTSASLHIDNTTILIDCGPDFRQQILQANHWRIDSILFTHHHNDHVLGLDDLRPINYLLNQRIDVYLNQKTFESLNSRFDYIFQSDYPGLPSINPVIIEAGDTLMVKGVEVQVLEVDHGFENILGYRIGQLVYITDAKRLSDQTLKNIQGCQVLVINALRHKTHKTHLTLDGALEYIHRCQPDKAYLIHISHLLGNHKDVEDVLPDNVYLAHDNLEVQID